MAMQHVIFSALLLSCSFFLPSCSPAQQYYQPLTQRPNKPWQGSSSTWGGYTERSLDKSRVKVTFETFNNPGPEFASYFSKVRAAEISLARGQNTFWLDDKGVKRWTEQSHFSGYVVPGYWNYHEHEVLHCTSHCKRGCRAHVDIIRERFWVPDRFVPPHTSVNLLSKAEVIFSPRSGGTRMSATSIIGDALSGRHGFGKPRFSPQTMNAYNRYLSPPAN
jgi:hypothetical protein